MDIKKSDEMIREARTILHAGTEGKGLNARDCIAIDILLQWATENLQGENIYNNIIGG